MSKFNLQFTIYNLQLALLAVMLSSCDPDAQWTTKDVHISISPYTVSAAYIECSFMPDKDAYYLVACQPAVKGVNPLDKQKQFMTLALDSANTDYIQWRYDLLKEGEFNIAPFASHCLQYGKIDRFFTNLTPDTDYWIYAFVVDPDKIQPVGKLFLQTVTTRSTSIVNVHFEYRVRGLWDYVYPLNPDGKINNHFPYLANTVDSLALVELWNGISPEEYFNDYFLNIAYNDLTDNVRRGVQVTYNDGLNSQVEFEEGHTYYTAIVSFDGFIGYDVIYRFLWTGDDFEAYFRNEDSIVTDGEDD